ncbi:MAG: hypothetical protein ACF8MF_12340 [Phycisphaerales bacterium JB052]
MTRTTTISMLLTLSAAAGLAMAQPATKESDNDLLRGPDVVENGVRPDRPEPMSEEEREAKMRESFEERPMELREMSVALRALGNIRSGKNELNLTIEQNDQVEAILRKYREDFRTFQQDNMVKIRQLREAMNKERREMIEQQKAEREEAAKEKEAAEPADAMQAADERPEAPAEGKAARQLREFIASSPAVQTAMASFRKVFSDEQYDLIEEHVFKNRLRAQGSRSGPNSEERRPARREMDDTEGVRQQMRERNRRNRDSEPVED